VFFSETRYILCWWDIKPYSINQSIIVIIMTTTNYVPPFYGTGQLMTQSI